MNTLYLFSILLALVYINCIKSFCCDISTYAYNIFQIYSMYYSFYPYFSIIMHVYEVY
jgi:hypothetical protein